MHSKRQISKFLYRLTLRTATVALVMSLLIVSGSAQNSVPPTAREAAALPAFASRLAHPGTRPSAPPARRRAPPAGQVLYDNGPINGTVDAWTINYGYLISDSFNSGVGTAVTGFVFGAWEFPGDGLTSVTWAITTDDCAKGNCGTTLGEGVVHGKNLTDQFISTNQDGYDVDLITASIPNVVVNRNTAYWFTLYNAVVPSGNPVYWDENSGQGCGGTDGKGANCPSSASENMVGTIASEAFTITGLGVPPPDPGPNFPASCIPKTFTVPNNFSACMQDPKDTRWFGREFTMDATFGDATGCCEYRQSVIGSFTDGNNNVMPFPLPTGDLSTTKFREDGITETDLLTGKPVVTNYGHRVGQAGFDGGQFARDLYTPPPRGTGKTYAGGDFPATSIPGVTINETFLGEIIDRCNGNHQVMANQWMVTCTKAGPPAAGSPASGCVPSLTGDARTQLAGLPIVVMLTVCQGSENVLNVDVAIANGLGDQAYRRQRASAPDL